MVILPWWRAHAVAFWCAQNHRGLAPVRGNNSVGSVNLPQIMAAALSSGQLLIGHAWANCSSSGLLVEEVVRGLAPRPLGSKGLHLASVSRPGCAPGCRSGRGTNRRPSRFPNSDHIPAAAGEQALERINDGMPRTIRRCRLQLKPLNQIVQPLARGGVRAGLGIRIAKHAPDFAGLRNRQALVGQKCMKRAW